MYGGGQEFKTWYNNLSIPGNAQEPPAPRMPDEALQQEDLSHPVLLVPDESRERGVKR